MKPSIGLVIIGRNEGKHLERCFTSLEKLSCPKVYVDSASTDNSLEIAKKYGIEAVALTQEQPLTAALGRNTGFFHLLNRFKTIQFVQFIDGDCHLEENWLEAAFAKMQEGSGIGLVNGILEEHNDSLSPFKQITALEWQMPAGQVKSSGGNCFIRVKAFQEIGGFNPEIPVAEDTELCLRLRLKGWRIWHLHQPMAVHDSYVVTFADFCKRAKRTGYGFSHVAWLHRQSPEKLFFRENLSTLFYGGILPLLAVGLAFWTHGLSLLLLILYPILFFKIYFAVRKQWPLSPSVLYAASCIFAKFPGFIGSCQFYYNKLLKRLNLIKY